MKATLRSSVTLGLLMGQLLVLPGCAGSVPVAAGAENVQVLRSPPQGSAERVKELRAVHGSGCGFLGGLGDEEGALALLRNQAREAGADYVQITRVVKPYSDGECRHNEYVIEGIAYRMKGDGSLQIAATGAASGAQADPTTPVAEKILSSCPGNEPSVAGGATRLSGGTCSYRMGALPSGSESSLTFSARLEGGPRYTIWPGGAWNGGHFRASALVYDAQGSGIRVIDYRKPASNKLSTLTRHLDSKFHTWRFARTRDRLVVWLDGQLLLVVEGAADGGEWGFHTEGGTLEVREIESKPLAAAEIAALRAHPLGWQAPVAHAGASGTKPVPAPGRRPGARPPRLVGSCDIDAIDWQNREYAGSGVSKGKPFKLEKGRHKLTSKKTPPDPVIGTTEQGTQLHFSGVVPADLDGHGLQEVVVSIGTGTYGVFHGNSPPPAEPESRYVFRLSEGCEPELLGFADFGADDSLRFEGGAMLRIQGSGDRYTVNEWRVVEGKLTQTASRKAGREALDEPLAACDEAKSLAELKKYSGRKGSELLDADPCVTRKLRERLGKKREKFEHYTSMGLNTLTERDGYLVSGGCMVRRCGFSQAAFSVHLTTGVVEAVIVDLTKEQRIGHLEWLTKDGKPLPPLRAPIDESVARSKALWD